MSVDSGQKMNTEILLAVTCGVVHFAKHAHMSSNNVNEEKNCSWCTVVASEGLNQENLKRKRSSLLLKNEEDHCHARGDSQR